MRRSVTDHKTASDGFTTVHPTAFANFREAEGTLDLKPRFFADESHLEQAVHEGLLLLLAFALDELDLVLSPLLIHA